MNDAQKHRGPDGDGVFEDPEGPIALGHVRLAVLDLSSGAAQPMQSADGRFVLCFNGEIYNYRELRRGLETRGCTFRSSGDTEVLLQGLQHDGVDFIGKLDGMFAFALWDVHRRELVLARDRLGVKPLYFAEPESGTLLFASEIKALCAHPSLPREPDFLALQQHLAFGHASGLRTALKHVKRVAPGSYLTWRPGQPLATTRYWKPAFGIGATPANAEPRLRELISSAVRRQLVSDVPYGAFLSGGLDSSLITALARDAGPINCYTTTYPTEDNRLDQAAADIPYARYMAKHLDARLEEITMTSDVSRSWPELIYHLDEPIADPAAIACHLICKLAHEDGTTVMLSGQGADELFAGYPRYWAIHSTRHMEMLPLRMRHGIASAASLIPGILPGKMGATLRRGRRVLTAAASDTGERFLNYCAATPQSMISGILSRNFQEAIGDESAIDECNSSLNRMEATEQLDRFLARDLQTYLPNHNLLYTDKMGMATGVEARVPFIDNELLDFVIGLPTQAKLKSGTTKYLLRKASRKIVPDRVIDRPKAGFGAPYRNWLRNDLAEMWQDLTDPESVKRRGWFDAAALSAIRQQSHSGKVDTYMLQWAVLTTELWARQFIDSNPADMSTTERSRSNARCTAA